LKTVCHGAILLYFKILGFQDDFVTSANVTAGVRFRYNGS
jgi:hypothetical protein